MTETVTCFHCDKDIDYEDCIVEDVTFYKNDPKIETFNRTYEFCNNKCLREFLEKNKEAEKVK